ncbi:carboxylesterase/lipase family protein [Lentzea aerocolonigenes]|uniref:carboxylesterase/lipase family protein n=1 Tax=Lentzea aerocolonigenes TaxID=68170 RepID=UPI0005653371|nr:carboxylesterase family protein [Lentzea aerocolonigenes]MCP2245493.1 para-nitrobenzyl esterase [Lentzea aerocolonigenes]
MVEVRVTAGTVRGTVEAGVAVFRGIPFAAPPVGTLRFGAPQPVAAWEGVREAVAFGPPPPQAGFFGMDGMGVAGDDWLTVNVWSSDVSGDLPVMVWIQGGGYTVGMSGLLEYDGTRLARDGVVVVTFNYRVGIEGFAAIEGAPANRGLLDQVAALEWVRDNIRAFGGDPARVTMFGQSAGGGSVAALLAMPRAFGLFHRAIASSVPGPFFTPELAADIAGVCAAELGLRPTVADLSTVDPTVLPIAGDEVMAKIGQFAGRWGQAAHKQIPFAPVVDGDVLPVTPWQALADGAARDVELIVGHTRHEQRLLSVLEGLVGSVTPEQASAALEVFAPGLTYPSAEPEELFELVCSDWLFRMPSLHLAEAQVAAGGRAFVYVVAWEPTPVFRACHGLDVPLVFGNLDRGQAAAVLGEVTADTEEVSALMRSAWTGFARGGDPGWPAYDTDSRLTRVFDVPPAVVAYPEETSRRIWAGHRFEPLPLIGGIPAAG